MLRNHLLLRLFAILVLPICFIVDTVAREAIIGGKKVSAEQFPYLVSLHKLRKGSVGFYCSGSIIDDLNILTAAHCVLTTNKRFKTSSITVVAGTNDISKSNEPAVISEVRKIYVHTEFAPPRVYTGDIAILRLLRPLELSKNRHLKPLQLPKNNRELENVHDGKTFEIAGWGWTWINVNHKNNIGGRNDTILRYAEADVISISDCQEIYPNRIVVKKQLCARVKQPQNQLNTRGTCQGDGGGPLVDNGLIIGILSEVSKNCSENNTAAIYTRVWTYRSFINNVVNNKFSHYIREYLMDV